MNIYTLEVFIISGLVNEKFARKNPIISRTLEIRGDQTLVEFHEIIFKAFDRYDEHIYEFQIGGKGPDDPKARRYGLPAYQVEISDDFKLAGDVEQTTIDSLKLKKDEAFGYWFDFGDNWWHQVNVIAIEMKTPKGRYPKITNRVGQSPPQYMEDDE
jgi:Plasmid pRiA4b ORF-3-like protein